MKRFSGYSKQKNQGRKAIRKSALQYNVPTVTTMTGAEALIEAIDTKMNEEKVNVRSLQEIHLTKWKMWE